MTSPQDLTKLYKKQISMTEWLEDIGYANLEAFREEDLRKRDRMGAIGKIIPFPFDEPTRFRATDLANKTPALMAYINAHGSDVCALRLVPDDPSLPKRRIRGFTVREVFEGWFQAQDIDPAKYQANFVPHALEPTWATIFVVNEKGMFGEIIWGGGHQLTQGFHASDPPVPFSYDFNTWTLGASAREQEMKGHLEEIRALILVPDEKKQTQLADEFDIAFAHNHMCGYYETIGSNDQGLIFTDFNRILGKLFKNFETHPHQEKPNARLTGQTGSPGIAERPVRIVAVEDIATAAFNNGDILVCKMTSPMYLPLMKKAAAIITDQGGILTHAAIVSRELGIPCLTGTRTATKTLVEGQVVRVDTRTRTVSIM